jgi:hypothetical protein
MKIATTLAKSITDIPYSGVLNIPTKGITNIELKLYNHSMNGASRLAPSRKNRILKIKIELTIHRI